MSYKTTNTRIEWMVRYRNDVLTYLVNQIIQIVGFSRAQEQSATSELTDFVVGLSRKYPMKKGEALNPKKTHGKTKP